MNSYEHGDSADADGDDASGKEPNVELAEKLYAACKDRPLEEGSPGWRYLTEARGVPEQAIRYCSADLRAIRPPIPGFDRLAHGVVSLVRDKDGEVTGFAIEACGPAGERLLDKDGRTARKSYALKKRGNVDALFRVAATGAEKPMIAYMCEGRLAKAIAVAAVFDDPAIYGWGGRNFLGHCIPAEPTIVIVEDARPSDDEDAQLHDRAYERGCDLMLEAGRTVLRAGPPPDEHKDIDAALTAGVAIDALRAWLITAVPVVMSLDGLARKCAKIKDVLARAQAVADVIADRELRKTPGMIPAFRHKVLNYVDDRKDDEALAANLVEDVIPWAEAVDGATVLDEVVAVIRRHVLLPIEAAHAVAIWAVHSHAIDLSWFNPRLALCSPVKRCGKTTLIEVLAGLVARAKPASGVTPAVVFRMITACKPTYLIDEADGYLPDNIELRTVLNSGHTRTSASVDRNIKVGDNWVPASFSTWCPLVVAGIGRLPTTLDDRSIKIHLQRKPRAVQLTRFRADRTAGITELGRKLARFVLDNQIAIGEADIEPPAELHDRAADNWRPMLAIASALGGKWPERAAAAAKALEAADSEASDLCVMVLEDIRDCFIARYPAAHEVLLAGDRTRANEIRLFTHEILSWLLGQPERPWLECNHGRALSQRGLANLLRPFGIATSKNVRRDNLQKKGVALDEFMDVFEAYIVFSPLQNSVPSVPTSQPNASAAHSGTDHPSHDPSQRASDQSQRATGANGSVGPVGTDAGTDQSVPENRNLPPEDVGENKSWDAGTDGTVKTDGEKTTYAPDGAEPSTTGYDKAQFLTCSKCNGLFPKPARGRPPKRCPACRGIKGADTTPTTEWL